MIDPASGEANEVLRRLVPSPYPVDQAMVVGWVKKRSIPGLIPMVAAVLTGDEVDVVEHPVWGITLQEALAAIHRHISTGVALSVIEDAARILTSIHELDPQRPTIHGQLSLETLILTPESELWISGFNGFRGDPQLDIRGLLHILKELLLPKAAKPRGAELLERLLGLQFDSALQLAETVNAHLKKQPFERRLAARSAFTTRLFEDIGSPKLRPARQELVVAGGINASSLAPSTELSVTGQPLDLGAEQAFRAALSNVFAVDDSSTQRFQAVESYAQLELDDEPRTQLLSQNDKEALSQIQTTIDEGEAGPFGSVPLSNHSELVSISAPQDAKDAQEHSREGIMAPAAQRSSKTSKAILVGNYRVVAALGKGGMGEIYLARSIADNRLVAIKVLGSTASGDEEALGMLMDEAAIMARIDHPHVLKVLDFGQAHGRYYLASEYLEGRPLVRIMIDSYDRDGGMDHLSVACIGAQAARGLHAAHTATTLVGAPLNVVHRDISPQNVFVTYRGYTKVIDFGVARASERFSETQIGLVKGKAAYMSPEQAEGGLLDARSDVFSLGICLWEMVAGKRLFKRPGDHETLMAVQTAPIEAPSIVRGQPDSALDRVIMQALRRDRKARTASAKELVRQLEAYLQARGVSDDVQCVRKMMGRLFHDESKHELLLIQELEARETTGTEGESNSSRCVNGVDNQAITVVSNTNSLRVLERYGEERQPYSSRPPREETGRRVIRKVREAAEERSADMTADASLVAHEPTAQLFSAGGLWNEGVASASTKFRRSHRFLPTAIIFGTVVGVGVGVLVTKLINQQLMPQTLKSQIVVPIERHELVNGLRELGAQVDPISGPIQTVRGISRVPFELDESSQVRWVEKDNIRGWLIELESRSGGPGVVWVRKRQNGTASVHGLSVNDCPAQASLDTSSVEVDYGSGVARLKIAEAQLNDVVLTAPEGADRLEIRPLALSFGRKIAGTELTHCRSGWRRSGRVILQRIPFGEYKLTWSGPRFEMSDQLRVGPSVVRGGLRVRGPFE